MPTNRLLPLLLVFAALLMLAPIVQAQPPIERQMTPEQFKAAGLDRLSPQELANLNAWLNHTLAAETSKAAELAKDKVESENRGFLGGDNEPIEARIVGEFAGFGRGLSWTLDNGQVWRQVDDAVLSGVRRNDPAVKLTPSVLGNTWFLRIEGYNARAKVQRIK